MSNFILSLSSHMTNGSNLNTRSIESSGPEITTRVLRDLELYQFFFDSNQPEKF